jgi:HPt (histidine-containing phosphotransfer) domain-containing protein
MIQSIIKNFKQDSAISIQKLLDAFQNHDLKTLKFFAHKQKSSSSVLGGTRLFMICKDIEEQVESDQLSNRIEMIQQELNLFIETLENEYIH